jgi:hypothetical protein
MHKVNPLLDLYPVYVFSEVCRASDGNAFGCSMKSSMFEPPMSPAPL